METQKYKIAVLIDQLFLGGVQKVAIEEVRHLRKIGYDASLLILMRQGYQIEIKSYLKGVPYRFLTDLYPKPLQKSIKFPFFHFFSTLYLLSPFLASLKIKKGQFDLIISHNTTTSFTSLSLFKLRKIPYMIMIHDPMYYILQKIYAETLLKFFFPVLKIIIFTIEKNLVTNAAVCFVASNVHAKFLEKNYGVKPKVLYLGTNPKKIPKDIGSKILSLGRWEKEKNSIALLDIATKIPTAKYLIVGSWSSKKDLLWFREEIEKRGLKKVVRLVTFFQENQLSDICAKARLWVHLHFEAFSLSALEAASRGIPILIPKGSGITELFENGKQGFFPNDGDYASFVKYIKILLKDPRLAQRMGQQAAQIAAKYTWKRHTQIIAHSVKNYLKPQQAKKMAIVIVESGHLSQKAVSGGDLLTKPMIPYLKKEFSFEIIIPKLAKRHWEDQKGIKLHTIPSIFLEKSPNPIAVFATYLWRSLFIFLILAKIKGAYILYSSTNVFPDWFSPYFIKKIRSDVRWITRIHHRLPAPPKREGMLISNTASYFLEKLGFFLMKSSDALIVLNPPLKKELSGKFFGRGKVNVLQPGINFKKINTAKIPRNTPEFAGIFVGRLHPTKGVLDLINIWKIVTDELPDATLAIVGEASILAFNKQLESQIEKNNLQKSIQLFGYLPYKNLVGMLKKSKVFLFTDYEAGFGLAVGEAMAAGLPVVGWNIGLLGSVFKSGFLTAPKKDIKSFAKNVITILKNPKYQKKLSTQSRVEASKFDWKTTSSTFKKIVNKA